MNWFYALNGQRQGPVDEARLDELIRAGTVQPNTLVWREGLPNWQPLSTARPSASPPAPLASPPVISSGAEAVCTECHRTFLRSEMLFLNNSWVCAQCKPLFLQRLMEGASPVDMAGQVWRWNSQVVMAPITVLPDRCVRCNAPANGFKLQRRLYWHHPGYYLLILISLLVYVIVALCVRKKAVIAIGLCEAHRLRRTRSVVASWLGALIGLSGLVAGFAAENVTVGVSGAMLLAGALIFAAVATPIVSAAKIETSLVRVKGAGQAFLATLPEWTGPV